MRSIVWACLGWVAVSVPALASELLLKDPTQPRLDNMIGNQRQLLFSSVVIGRDQPWAVINGKVVTVGDTIYRATVVEIKPNYVVIDEPQRGTVILPLSHQVSKPSS
jgi:CBS-domain-containing membrane protein